jgi:hypothetical protein
MYGWPIGVRAVTPDPGPAGKPAWWSELPTGWFPTEHGMFRVVEGTMIYADEFGQIHRPVDDGIGTLQYQPLDPAFRGWDYAQIAFTGPVEETWPLVHTIALAVGYEEPEAPVADSRPGAPTFPATLEGLKQALEFTMRAMEQVVEQCALLGQLVHNIEAAIPTMDEDGAEAALAALENRQREQQEYYDYFLKVLAAAQRVAGQYMQDSWGTILLREFLRNAQKDWLVRATYPGLVGLIDLIGAPDSSLDVIEALVSIRAQVAHLAPSREQWGELAAAFADFGGGAAVMVRGIDVTVTRVEQAQQILQWTSAIGLTIVSGGAPVVLWRHGGTTLETLRAAAPLLLAVTQTAAVAVDQYADWVTKFLGLDPQKAKYVRWGARAVQLVTLLLTGKVHRWGQVQYTGAMRRCYAEEVRGLAPVGQKLLAAGRTEEEVARALHAMRREIGAHYKRLTPQPLRQQVYDRNNQQYGDPLGPTIEWLRARNKSWRDIIESSSRPGGHDLGL